MKIETAINDYLLDIEVRQYTPKTLRTYRNNLNLFNRFLLENTDTRDIEDLSLREIRLFIKYMTDRKKKGSYINGILKGVKSFIQYCFDEGYGGFNTKRNFKWVKEEKAVVRAFTVDDVNTLLRNCKGSGLLDVRDRAVITMFLETGIRNSELCGIRNCDIHEDFIIINGKNHKQRVVPITPILRKAMLRYKDERDRYYALKNIDDTFFLSFHGRALTPTATEHILKQRGEGIEGIRVSPHTCRHFYAQQQVKLGTDLYTISRLLGHENIGITQIYLNSLRDEEIIQIAKSRSVLMNMR